MYLSMGITVCGGVSPILGTETPPCPCLHGAVSPVEHCLQTGPQESIYRHLYGLKQIRFPLSTVHSGSLSLGALCWKPASPEQLTDRVVKVWRLGTAWVLPKCPGPDHADPCTACTACTACRPACVHCVHCVDLEDHCCSKYLWVMVQCLGPASAGPRLSTLCVEGEYNHSCGVAQSSTPSHMAIIELTNLGVDNCLAPGCITIVWVPRLRAPG
jgi:hypothetical protein